MIKRNYYYYVVYESCGTHTLFGLITVKSWLPAPRKAFDKVINVIKENSEDIYSVKKFTFHKI